MLLNGKRVMALSHGIDDIPTQRAVRALETASNFIADSLESLNTVVDNISGGSGVPLTRLINTTAPLTGGGALSADLTLGVSTFGSGASGVVPASGGGTANYLRADGTWATPPGSTPSGTGFVHVTAGVYDTSAELTGDVTAGAGGVTTIGNDKVTYAKMQNVSATNRLLGRITAGAGDPEELTGTQATTLMDVFTSSLKGVAPSSGGGTINFLRADGAWANPLVAGLWITLFGDGPDSDVTFDGTSTVNLPDGTSLVPAASVYTLTRDLFPHNMTVLNGVTIKCAGYRILGSGTLTNNGRITNGGVDGASATGAAAGSGGAAGASGSIGGGTAGGNGGGAGAQGGSGTNSGANTNPAIYSSTNSTSNAGAATDGNGSAGQVTFKGGGSGATTIAGAPGGTISVTIANDGGADFIGIMRGNRIASNAHWTFGTGGAGGSGHSNGGDTGRGGGGGGGGGCLVLHFPTITYNGGLAGTGTIDCNGGHGGDGNRTNNGHAGGGGGGGGGFAQVMYWTRSGNAVTATGGVHGNGAALGGNGGDGHDGIVRTINLSGDGT